MGGGRRINRGGHKNIFWSKGGVIKKIDGKKMDDLQICLFLYFAGLKIRKKYDIEGGVNKFFAL